jgi:hypothetical protein
MKRDLLFLGAVVIALELLEIWQGREFVQAFCFGGLTVALLAFWERGKTS